jgi:hypothetical protein
MIVTHNIKFKREREVKRSDRFFVIKFQTMCSGILAKAISGWIEEKFVESNFKQSTLENTGLMPIGQIEIIAEFDNEAEYEKYKKDSNLGF